MSYTRLRKRDRKGNNVRVDVSLLMKIKQKSMQNILITIATDMPPIEFLLTQIEKIT